MSSELVIIYKYLVQLVDLQSSINCRLKLGSVFLVVIVTVICTQYAGGNIKVVYFLLSPFKQHKDDKLCLLHLLILNTIEISGFAQLLYQ